LKLSFLFFSVAVKIGCGCLSRKSVQAFLSQILSFFDSSRLGFLEFRRITSRWETIFKFSFFFQLLLQGGGQDPLPLCKLHARAGLPEPRGRGTAISSFRTLID